MKSHKDDSNNTRIAILENNIIHINETLLRIENKLSSIDAKIDSNYKSLDTKMDAHYQTLDKKIDSKFFWTLGILITIFAAPLINTVLKMIHFIN